MLQYLFKINSRKHYGTLGSIPNNTFYLRAQQIPSYAKSFLQIKYMRHIELITLQIYTLSMTIQEIKYLHYVTRRGHEYYYSYTEDELLEIFDNDYLDIYSKKIIIMLLPIHSRQYQLCFIHYLNDPTNIAVMSIKSRKMISTTSISIFEYKSLLNYVNSYEIQPKLWIRDLVHIQRTNDILPLQNNTIEQTIGFDIKPGVLIYSYYKLIDIINSARLINKLQ